MLFAAGCQASVLLAVQTGSDPCCGCTVKPGWGPEYLECACCHCITQSRHSCLHTAVVYAVTVVVQAAALWQAVWSNKLVPKDVNDVMQLCR